MNYYLLPLLLSLSGCTGASDDDNTGPSQQHRVVVYSTTDTATFAGGCFWCMEAVFERVKGVTDVISGYSGGGEEKPTYYEVGSGKTGHAESVQIFFNDSIISYSQLLDIFFHLHDPTQADGQHPDYGPQYRSAVFYRNEEQRAAIDATIERYQQQSDFSKPIVTEVSSFTSFYLAEEYHQDFYRLNPKQAYVVAWTIPKVKKLQKLYPDWYVDVPVGK